ncbi:MAG: polysaccharide biosynthesis protein [Bacteroidetes bacterium]|nr:polysaccharide biosynthesis protein [Bacteroidota bacterium]
MLLFERTAPRWIIFLIDLFICFFALIIAYLLRFNFAAIPQVELDTFPLIFPFVIGVRALSFFISKTHKGIVRYTSSRDAQRIFIVTTLGSIFFAIANIIKYYFITDTFIIPFSILVIEYMTTTFLMISLRLIFKSIYLEWKNPSRTKTSVIIFGSGESGIITKRTLDRDAGMKYKVLAFIDDNEKKWESKLEGITIYGFNKLEELLRDGNVAHMIISVQNIPAKRKEEIVEICLKYNTKILNVPPVSSWINGELSFKQIKKVRIEDLLERNPIKLDMENIKRQTRDKVILVTGAAGSIGSEIVRQLSKFNSKKIVLIDTAESPLYEMEMELKNIFHLRSFEIVIADVRNKERMESIFSKYSPQVVYHAAAYKHVPMMEHHPLEAIQTNVLGTKIMADLAVKHGVEKFVMVSTDKAVNPTNVMGASKRIAEMYVQSLSPTPSLPFREGENKSSPEGGVRGGCKFITTRFGNVLGSNGSVIQLFRHQIERGGPISVTHPDITRFFMTIPEACQLVLEAGAMGKGGEIFVFDMGQSVKIADLAKKMIQLAGLTLGKDIQIVYTGLRPGEKLFEELLATKENTLPTHNPQIMVGKVREYGHEEVSEKVGALISLLQNQDSTAIVKRMKEIVPEFRSQNSVYEELDKQQKPSIQSE